MSDAALGVGALFECLEDALTRRCGRLARKYTRVKKHPDQEAVHDVRVACRRFLSVIQLAEAIEKKKAHRKMRKNLKGVLRHYSDLRDAQVQMETLNSVLPEGAQPAVEYHRLMNERIEALKKKTLSSTPRMDFKLCRSEVKRFRRFAKKTRKREAPERIDHSAAAVALVDRFFKGFGRRRQESLSERTPSSVHRARIKFKRLRYAMEVLQTVLPGADSAYMQRLAALQASMGDLQDLTVLREDMEAFASRMDLADGVRAELAAIDGAISGKLEKALEALQAFALPWRSASATNVSSSEGAGNEQ